MTGLPAIPGKLVGAVFGRVLAQDLTPELKHQLAREGVDVALPQPDSVPRETWDRAMEVTAAALFPKAEPPDALRHLGRHVVTVLPTRGLLKGPWLSMAKLLGPKRALKQGAELGVSNSPIHVKVVDRGSREVEVHIDDGKHPELLAGLLEGLVSILGGRDVHVLVASAQPASSVLIASWR